MLGQLAARNVLGALAVASYPIAAAATTIEDSFNRSSSDLDGDTPDVSSNGQTWVSTTSEKIVCDTTSSGRAYPSATSNNADCNINFLSANQHITVNGTLRNSATGTHRIGCSARYSSSTARWRVLWDRNAATKLGLYEYPGGTARATYAASVTGTHDIGVKANGTSLELLFDGATVGSHTSSTNQSNTKVELQVEESQTTTDTLIFNFKCQSP